MKFVDEFKAFILRGNVVDLAVAVVIGGAFGKIVNSFVNDILMPPIGILTGGIDFSRLEVVLKDGASIKYGLFVNNVISFVIIAFSVFILIKMLSRLKRKTPPKEPTEKTCPECCQPIPKQAKKCFHCCSSQ